MNLVSRGICLPLLAGALLAASGGCIITTNGTTSDSASSDGSAASSGGESTGGTGGSSSTAAPTEGGSSTAEPTSGGSTSGSTNATTSVSSGGPVAQCGWDAANMYYDCGFDGDDPDGTYPRDCPGDLVEGDPCGSVPGQGCCDAEGNNWYCGDDGMGGMSLVKTVCQ